MNRIAFLLVMYFPGAWRWNWLLPHAAAWAHRDEPRVSEDELAAALYDAYWARQKFPDPTPFAGQAEAIKKMWRQIGSDARRALAERG